MGSLRWQHWPGNPHALRPRDRRSGQFQAYVPHTVADWQPMIPADVAAFAAEAERALREAAEASSGIGSSGLFFWAESLGSSRIEGVMPGTRQVVHALAAERAVPGRVRRGPVGEVLGNIDATTAALDTLADPVSVTVRTLTDAHRLLMDNSPEPHLGGRVRSDQNWIGGNDWHPLEGDFVPPPAEHCPALLDDLCAYLRGADHSPLLQAAIAHVQFETIHPFGDGNGRTGRAVLYAALKHRCAPDGTMPPVSLALSRNRDAYLASLAEYQTYLGDPDDPRRTGALVPWLEVLATAMRQASAAVGSYQAAIEQLLAQWRARTDTRQARSVVTAAISHLPAHPSLTATALADLTGYSQRRCADALRRLEVAGVVKGRTLGPLLRVYDADKVLEAYEVMASTMRDPAGAADAYAEVLASPFIEQTADPHTAKRSADSGWQPCPRQVTSTGQPCGLQSGHRGHCRSLPHRRNQRSRVTA